MTTMAMMLVMVVRTTTMLTIAKPLVGRREHGQDGLLSAVRVGRLLGARQLGIDLAMHGQVDGKIRGVGISFFQRPADHQVIGPPR